MQKISSKLMGWTLITVCRFLTACGHRQSEAGWPDLHDKNVGVVQNQSLTFEAATNEGAQSSVALKETAVESYEKEQVRLVVLRKEIDKNLERIAREKQLYSASKQAAKGAAVGTQLWAQAELDKTRAQQAINALERHEESLKDILATIAMGYDARIQSDKAYVELSADILVKVGAALRQIQAVRSAPID